MYHIVYMTTNLINGKRYIGDHSTNNLNDNYLGSGLAINNAIKKYGSKNFCKQVLEEFNTKQEAFNAQERYIKEFDTLEPNGYNISPKGGHQISNGISDETKKKISRTLSGRSLSEEHIKNMIISRIGRKLSNKTKKKLKNSLNGHIVSKETRDKISNSHKGKKLSEETKIKIGLGVKKHF